MEGQVLFQFPGKGHPSSHCPNIKSNKDDNNKSRTSASSNKTVKKSEKGINTINKNFNIINNQLAQIEENDSDLSDSETE